jgi:hypothetical protein
MEIEYFLKTLKGLQNTSPRLFSTSRDNENSLYTDGLAYSKNAYYIFTGGWIQDCYYGEFLVKCQDCVDCLKIEQSILCYECVDCIKCYNSNFLLKCSSVQDSEFCIGLRDCSSCFLSTNLEHASFFFQNTKYAKEEYEELVAAYKKEMSANQLYKEWLELCIKTPRLNLNLTQCDNCIGNNISFSRNVYMGFDLINAEDFLYSDEGGYGKDCCDTFVTTGELNYECVEVTKNSYNCNFCASLTTCANCEFCTQCWNCSDCFGCANLKDKKFHILNRAYTEAEYKPAVASLKMALRNAEKYSFELMVN